MTGIDSWAIVAATNATADGLFLHWPGRGIDGVGSRPAKAINALANSVTRNASFLAPLLKGHGNPANRYPAIIGSVVLLFLLRRPAAVFGRIAAGIVNAVYRVFGGRALAHVFQEIGVILPPRAHAASLVFPVRHANPNSVSSGFPATFAVAVSGPFNILSHYFFGVVASGLEALAVHIGHKAPARSGVSKYQPGGRRGDYFPALALTFPQSVMGLIHPQTAQRCKPSELLSCQIFRCAHDWH